MEHDPDNGHSANLAKNWAVFANWWPSLSKTTARPVEFDGSLAREGHGLRRPLSGKNLRTIDRRRKIFPVPSRPRRRQQRGGFDNRLILRSPARQQRCELCSIVEALPRRRALSILSRCH